MIKNVAQQLKQIARDTLETVKDQPKELGAEALEQLGVRPKKSSPPEDPTFQIQKMAKLDKQQSDQQAQAILKKIDDEIKQAQIQRERQLQERRQQSQPTAEEVAVQQAVPLPDTTKSTPKRGGWLFGAGRRKNRSAFDQFSSEKRQGSGVGG